MLKHLFLSRSSCVALTLTMNGRVEFGHVMYGGEERSLSGQSIIFSILNRRQRSLYNAEQKYVLVFLYASRKFAWIWFNFHRRIC